MRVHARRELRSIIGNINTSQFYASMRTIVQDAPLELIHTSPRGSTHAITTCSLASVEDFVRLSVAYIMSVVW